MTRNIKDKIEYIPKDVVQKALQDRIDMWNNLAVEHTQFGDTLFIAKHILDQVKAEVKAIARELKIELEEM